MWLHILWCSLFLAGCHGVIYHLNDTEHSRMPRLFELDHYDTCLSDAKGLYCVVKLDLYPGQATELMELIKEYSAYTSKHYNYTYIERGVCVTKTCKEFVEKKNLSNTVDFLPSLEACLNDSIWKNYNLEAKLKDVYYCNKANEQTNIDIGDWIVAAVFVVLISFVIIGSFYDVFGFGNDGVGDNLRDNKLLMNFSLRKNWIDLVKPKEYDPRLDILKGLHGMRSITICLMIIAHVIFINSMGFIHQPHDFEKTYETFHFHLIYNGLMIVQIFFLMAAFLQAYFIQLHSETTSITWSHLPKLLFVRWWRLTPANAVMIAFTATWLRHVGSGPLWKLYVSNSVVAHCRRFWWLHLTYLNNFQPEDKFCALQTWHIATDTQLFVIGMLVYLATMSRGRALVLSLMMLLGMAAPAIHVYLQDFDGLVLQTPEFYRTLYGESFFHLHILGHANLPCYVIGLAAGSLLYYWQKKNLDFSRYKKWGALAWLIIPAIGYLFLSGRGFYAEGDRAPLGVRVLYAGTHRAVFGLLVAGAVITLTMRLSDSFCNFFEWKGWLVPSKLSYSVYLLHMNLVHILLGLKTQLGLVSSFNMLVVYFGVVTMSTLMALPFYLIVEAPMTGLLKIFFKSTRRKVEVEKIGKKTE